MQLEQLASLLAVGALLGALGRGITGMVFPDGTGKEHRAEWTRWQWAFFVTMWVHPIVAGALVGIPGWLPAPAFLGDQMAGRVIWYALAGAFSSPAFYRMDRTIHGQGQPLHVTTPPPRVAEVPKLPRAAEPDEDQEP